MIEDVENGYENVIVVDAGNFLFRRTGTFPTSEEEDKIAAGLVSRGLSEMGYHVVVLHDHAIRGLLHKVHQMIDVSAVYVGTDNDVSYVAMATETPVVMAFSYRDPMCRHPFRGGVPFRALTPAGRCPYAEHCLELHGAIEKGVLHWVRCPEEPPEKCRTCFTAADFLEAVEEVTSEDH